MGGGGRGPKILQVRLTVHSNMLPTSASFSPWPQYILSVHGGAELVAVCSSAARPENACRVVTIAKS